MRNEKNYDDNREEALSVLESASFKVLKKSISTALGTY
jgi:hypothetical protein